MPDDTDPSRTTATASPEAAPRWMARWLIAAGLYNLFWGAAVVLWPQGLVDLGGVELTPAGLAIWQCLGMVIGVYGIGYLAASTAPLRHWPIVLVGLLGKVFGPIGFLWTASRGEIPWSFGWTILTNDLLWWAPFLLILRASWRSAIDEDRSRPGPSLPEALAEATDQEGVSIAARSMHAPLLLVVLRHFGCTFCREAVADVVARRGEIERDGLRIVLVAMATPPEADAFLSRHHAGGLLRVCDPQRRLIRALGLSRGSLGSLFGPRNFLRAAAAMLRGHGIGPAIGDPLQMPGVFRIDRGRVTACHRHRFAGERPPYERIACELPSPVA